MTTPSEEPESPERAELLDALAEARERTNAQVEALARDLDQMFEASELMSPDDEHDPEGATIAYERAQLTALLAQAQEDLGTLDGALTALLAGDDVRCTSCGQPIAPERLLALPTARTCIRCAPR